ncbi:MAG: arylesterase [Bacteroidota bacterium]
MRFALSACLLFALAACSSPDPAEAPPVAEPAAVTTTAEADSGAVTVVYLGDSLTAGYGLPQGADQAYPALIDAKADSLGIAVRTVNAGISGDTSAGGLRRIDWLAGRQQIDVLVLALGANDGLRGLPTDALQANLEAMIERARTSNPDVRVVLAGMMVPTNMGTGYAERFAEVFPAVAREQGVELVPFLLDRVGGVPALNQPDGVHPTTAGQRIMAETVWRVLGPVLNDARVEA